MRISAVLCTVLLSTSVLCACEPSSDEVPLIPRADLFGNPERAASHVSPDGKWISWLAPVNGVMNIWLAPVGQMEAARPITNDTGRGIGVFPGYAWTYDGRHIVYHQDRNGDENWHVYALDIETHAVRDLTPLDNIKANLHWAGVSSKLRDEILVSLNRRDPRFHDLYRVNLQTGQLTLAAENSGFWYFVPDAQLVPKIAVKVMPSGELEWHKPSRQGWEPWLSIPADDTRATYPWAINAAATSLFAIDSRGRNTAALVRIDLADGQSTVIAENARSDISYVAIHQETHEPVGYSFILARRENRALRPELQTDFDFLNAQNLGDWSVDSRSEDERYWKVTTRTDYQVGVALYDRQARTVTKLYDTRPRLSGTTLARMYPITIKSRDGLDLVSYLSLPRNADLRQMGVPDAPVPLVLVVHGGPWLRDSFGFNEVHQWLANRGYAALSVNFRASTGFGKAFVNAGNGEWGGKISDDLLDAVNWAIQNKIADPQRVAIMGLSFGGYSTLVGMTRDAGTYACGFDIAGISDLEFFVSNVPPYWAADRPLLLKGAGDPSTEEGRTLMRARSPLHQADRISKPLLVVHGDNDARVNSAAADRIVAAVKANGVPVTYLSYPDEGHFIQRPENNLSMYAVAEQFFAECLGGRAEPITADSLKGSSLQVLEGAQHIEGLQAAISGTADIQ